MKLQRLYVEYTLTNALYDLRRSPSKKRGVVAQPFKYIIVAMCEVVKDKDFGTEAFLVNLTNKWVHSEFDTYVSVVI